ncbi:MAG TPA: TonB-dependent receptor [Gemmatimonadaceae bacterium]|jgi:hypothetical protein|nr:TonB-dependent receptor [Gemmatimonadaceae bacterium]
MSKLTSTIAGAVGLLTVLVGEVALGAPCGAQQQAGATSGVVSGTVHDSLGNILANVEVTATKVARSVRTDTAGRFVLGGLPGGAQDLSVRRLAYSPAVVSVEVSVGDTTEVEIELGVVAQQLTAVVVQDDADRMRTMAAFESRRKLGIGHFITRSQIESRHPMLLSDMVRMVPGAMLMPTDNGRSVLRFSRSARNCPPQFYVDGMEVYGFSIDDMPPGDVEGVELYGGPAGLPPEFNRMHSNSICGVVVIWTRVPGSDKKR